MQMGKAHCTLHVGKERKGKKKEKQKLRICGNGMEWRGRGKKREWKEVEALPIGCVCGNGGVGHRNEDTSVCVACAA